MKFTTISVAAALIAATNAQVTFADGKFTCATPNKDYCGGDSLNTNIIIRCTGTVGTPGNCNDNLAGIAPVGVKSDALCYQSSTTAGDAACSFEGTAYPDSGSPFKIGGGSVSSMASSSALSTSVVTASSLPVYTSVIASSPAVYTSVVASSPAVYSSIVASSPAVYSSVVASSASEYTSVVASSAPAYNSVGVAPTYVAPNATAVAPTYAPTFAMATPTYEASANNVKGGAFAGMVGLIAAVLL